MLKKPEKFALIAPNENLEVLIAYLTARNDCEIDHFPTLEVVEDHHTFPFGQYQLVIIDSRVTDKPIDTGVLESLKAVFGDCGFVVIDRDSQIKDISSDSIEHLKGDPGITDILEAALGVFESNSYFAATN